MRTDTLFTGIGAAFGALSVVLGAFGAHALKARLSPEQLQTFETGVRYQMYHALALLLLAALFTRLAPGFARASGWCFVLGAVLFSGSLYLLATAGWRWLGPITPFGGLCFIVGWVLLAAAALRGV
jgi:uncharacterized membrane protein YgdD (TMEM256/DUF423 family)